MKHTSSFSKIALVILLLVSNISLAQVYKKYSVKKDKVCIELSEGILNIIPINNEAVRIQWQKDLPVEKQEFVLINKQPIQSFKVTETSSQLKISTKGISVSYNKKLGTLAYSNAAGKVFLCEKANSRKLVSGTVMGEKCYSAELGFDSPADEYLFGLGQFQDGHYNLRNVSRKLIQVNTQIAIPFLYSSKGYGILWHQYGLTYFNPADNYIELSKKDTNAVQVRDAEVTTTAGTQRVSQQQSLHVGKFTLAKDGDYTFMLDLGDMDNRHLLIIDGIARIDQSNQWLPPAVSKIVSLKAGEHSVQVLCKSSNKPKLSWKAVANESVFRSPNAKSLDYMVFYGGADEVITNYRNLSGNVPMLPLWAYGFWQCRERYTSGKHLVETIKEFRKRNLPVDVIVQDWQYWGKYGWGVPKFDETNYPNPEGFIKELHDLNSHFSVSVWENLDKKSDVAKPYLEKKLYLENSPWIDIYNPETQKTHWNALNTNLFSKGVDSWWMDATEPENDALAGKQTFFGPGDFYRLTYPLFVSKAVYEGQRAADPNKRVTILTRSAFPGQQRFGTINWSGDIGWNWDVLKRQIVAGLNYNLTGMPYWTTDIGGFFRPGRGQYTDEKYHDILTRWFQWGAFSPIFRIHGYQTETEPWKYGEKVESNMRNMMNTRYRLMPYIYSEAWQVSKNGSTLMRPLVMDFASDAKAVQQGYEYMFGKSLLIAPVTEANVTEWNVYLPKAAAWYDYWSGKRYTGGQSIKVAAPQDQIPVFVKAGSIVPMAKVMQFTGEKPLDVLEIRLYKGANGNFVLYEDEGDGYNYEKGAHTTIQFKWNDVNQTLSIGARVGWYKSYLKSRVFNIVVVSNNNGGGIAEGKAVKKIAYSGAAITLKL
jgi:alpha-D-xyloside xylohydrolase